MRSQEQHSKKVVHVLGERIYLDVVCHFPIPKYLPCMSLGCALTPTQDPDICAPTKVSPEMCGKNSISEVKSSFIGSVGWGEGGGVLIGLFILFSEVWYLILSQPPTQLLILRKRISLDPQDGTFQCLDSHKIKYVSMFP